MVVGMTPSGRATVMALQLNRPGLVNLRRILAAAGEHPPPLPVAPHPLPSRDRHAGQRREDAGRHQAGGGTGHLSQTEHQPARVRQAARRGQESRDSGAAARRAAGTDANAIQLARDGVATGLVGIPNRYMHSPVEAVSLDDLERAARLLAEFCLSVTPEMDWVP